MVSLVYILLKLSFYQNLQIYPNLVSPWDIVGRVPETPIMFRCPMTLLISQSIHAPISTLLVFRATLATPNLPTQAICHPNSTGRQPGQLLALAWQHILSAKVLRYSPAYTDKIYELGQLASRFYFTRSYFPLYSEVNLKQVITYWRRMPYVSSIRVGIKDTTFQNVPTLQVAVCINFTQLTSLHNSNFPLHQCLSYFLKLTWSIASCLQHLGTYTKYKDYQNPIMTELSLMFEPGQAADQLAHRAPVRQAHQSSLDLASEVRREECLDDLLVLLQSYRPNNLAILINKIRKVADKHGINIGPKHALSEGEDLLKK